MNPNWRVKFERLHLDPEQCTCLNCPDDQTCPYAFDVYNYDGDCLGEHKMFQSRSPLGKHLNNFLLKFNLIK